MRYLTTGQLAKEAKVNVETIRYYEKRALLPKPKRKVSGYRMWPEETVKRIRFIKHAQELGFSLKEIKELLSIKTSEKNTCLDVKKLAEEKIREIEEKIDSLKKIKTALQRLAKTCPGKGPVSECPILDELERL